MYTFYRASVERGPQKPSAAWTTKKVKTNPPKRTGRKKNWNFFPAKKKNILRLTSPLIPNRYVFQMCTCAAALILGVDGVKAVASSEAPGQSGILLVSLVDDLVDGGFLVARSCHDVFVIRRDVAAQDRGRLLWLRRTEKGPVKCEEQHRCLS